MTLYRNALTLGRIGLVPGPVRLKALRCRLLSDSNVFVAKLSNQRRHIRPRGDQSKMLPKGSKRLTSSIRWLKR